MITEEHLKHWVKEINYQLNGIFNEITPDKVVLKGINVGHSGESWVSFEYLQEKASLIQVIMELIEDEMEND